MPYDTPRPESGEPTKCCPKKRGKLKSSHSENNGRASARAVQQREPSRAIRQWHLGWQWAAANVQRHPRRRAVARRSENHHLKIRRSPNKTQNTANAAISHLRSYPLHPIVLSNSAGNRQKQKERQNKKRPQKEKSSLFVSVFSDYFPSDCRPPSRCGDRRKKKYTRYTLLHLPPRTLEKIGLNPSSVAWLGLKVGYPCLPVPAIKVQRCL